MTRWRVQVSVTRDVTVEVYASSLTDAEALAEFKVKAENQEADVFAYKSEKVEDEPNNNFSF
jgi:hypothetical protein